MKVRLCYVNLDLNEDFRYNFDQCSNTERLLLHYVEFDCFAYVGLIAVYTNVIYARICLQHTTYKGNIKLNMYSFLNCILIGQ